jgi:hypothetical protein
MSPNRFSVTITSKSAGGDELHGGVVDEQVLELDVRELLGVHAADHLAPQARGLEHVGLVDARDALRRPAAERRARDPLDLRDRVGAASWRGRRRAVFAPK